MAHAPDSLRVLLVEDDEDDFVITRDLLAGQRRTLFELEWMASYEAGRDAIREARHDVYLIDYRLGERTGLDLVREAFSESHQAPVIVLTGHANYEVDLEATLLGVTDFLEKGQLDTALLERSIRYAVGHHATLAELRQSQERYALAVRGANDGTWDWNLASERVYLSQRWKAMLGYDEDEVGDSMEEWLGRVHPDDVGELRAALDAHLDGANSHLESEHRVAHRDGNERWVLVRGAAIWDENGKATRVAGSMTDITDQKAAEARLLHESMHDSLTGLPNRALFLDRLEHSLARAERDHGQRCAVLFLDIDRFKLVNDGFSHAAGDRLLVALATRLAHNLRPGDTVARFGGDEFTILLDSIGSDEEPQQVADRIQEALALPFDVVGQQLVVSASIGIAVGEQGSKPDEMVRDADIAMYNAKRGGAARSATFTAPMHSHVVSQLHLEGELRRAIDDELLRVFYQPIFGLRNGELSGFEALARWPESDEPVSPAEFIPVAEETGLIGGLGRLVLDRACACLREWRERGVVEAEVTMSVNVSARQFMEPSLVTDVVSALERHRLPPSALRLEITESTVLWEPAYMTAVLRELAAVGVRAQVDDFGTGYSSLTFLQHFAGDALKIDRSFVSSMDGGSGSDAIVRAVIALAHNLGLEVVAEGVETSDTLSRLRMLGCDYAQGFLLGRPVEAAEAERMAGTWGAPRTTV